MPYVQVWVNTEDSLSEASDEDIREEYISRFKTEPENEVVDAIELLERGDVEEALLLLRQIVYPKFKSLDDCLNCYARARRSQ